VIKVLLVALAALPVEPLDFPPDLESQTRAALTLINEGRPGKALPILQKLVEASPDVAALNLVLGMAEARTGVPDAERHLRRALELGLPPGVVQAAFGPAVHMPDSLRENLP
jgi:hypothetical protein